ncbi:MAG: HEPN domain-containing protein, partial [Candidatus Nanohaloarchaea archaeon]
MSEAELEQWIGNAEEDLEAAEQLSGSHPNQAAFHLHQAVEKALKPIQIQEKEEYDFSQDLLKLAADEARDEFLELLKDLNPVYTASRYPDVTEGEVENVGRLIERTEVFSRVDEKTAGEVKDTLEEAANRSGIRLEKVIMFGSRSRDDYREGSDVDLLIVSPDFEGVAWNKRPGPFYEAWDYENMPAPEFV